MKMGTNSNNWGFYIVIPRIIDVNNFLIIIIIIKLCGKFQTKKTPKTQHEIHNKLETTDQLIVQSI